MGSYPLSYDRLGVLLGAHLHGPGRDLRCRPLRKLAKKLENGVMLEVEDIERAKANIEFTRQVFRVTPASILKQHSITEQIAIEFEKRDLIKEAA